jgi:hypothetical protein
MFVCWFACFVKCYEVGHRLHVKIIHSEPISIEIKFVWQILVSGLPSPANSLRDGDVKDETCGGTKKHTDMTSPCVLHPLNLCKCRIIGAVYYCLSLLRYETYMKHFFKIRLNINKHAFHGFFIYSASIHVC